MKKIFIRFIPLTMTLLLSLAGAAFLTACSDSDSTSSDAESTTEAEPATEAAADTSYSICSGISESVSGDVRTITTDHFTMSLGLCDTWTYDYTDDMFNLYSVRSARLAEEAGDGPNGFLVEVRAIDLEDVADSGYDQWGQYFELGEADGKFYVANFPTDVRWNMDDPGAEEEYRALDDILRADSSWITITDN